MGWTPPAASLCQSGGVENTFLGRHPWERLARSGSDIAKNVFQAHGVDASGRVVFRKKIARRRLVEFFATQPLCMVALEACGGAHHWGREIRKSGHSVRLIPPAYVKPFMKRPKHDAADAEAICEAAQRPNMRFVAVKDKAQQASSVVLFVNPHNVYALRGHLAEYGCVAPKGTTHVETLIAYVKDPTNTLPHIARLMLEVLIGALVSLKESISVLDAEIARRAKEDPVARRLTTVPGVGPITAAAIAALAPQAESFKRGRDFAAWLGLTPLERSTGGKTRLDATSKMGERTIRQFAIIGASAVVRQACRRSGASNPWLNRMLARKPRMLVTVAAADKTARIIWALLAKDGVYQAPMAA
jgi:transposase